MPSGSEPDNPYPDDRALVARIRAGDEQAFRDAVVRYSPGMIATARAIVGAANAEDVVQEAWLAAFRQIGAFEHRAALGTWLQRVVTNRAISDLRRRAREIAPPDRGDRDDVAADWFDELGHWATPPPVWNSPGADELLEAAALRDCIDKHIDLMPDNQRLVLLMRDLQSESYDEICNKLNLSASNVRVLLHRGRTRLMKMINGYQETGTC
ncbi:MAG: RNA polymerase sigma factor [Pseudomonadales bacterium]